MTNTPLEDRVHDALHRRVDPLQHAPLTVSDVRRRAGRIQLRRRVAAGAAVAAVLAIAVPVGLGLNGPAQRGDVPPATQPTAPQVTGTVLIDPRSAEPVASTTVPLVDVDGPSLITPEETIELPHVYDTITPYLGGWVARAMDEGWGTIEFLSDDLEVTEQSDSTGGLVASADGQRIAWSEYTGTQWQVVIADPTAAADWTYVKFPPGPEEQQVEPVGFVSDGEVVMRQNDGSGTISTFIGDGDTLDALPGPVTARSASAATGMVAAVTRSDVEGSCSAVLDGTDRSGAVVWETCDHALTAFSPSGQYVVGLVASGGEYGSPTLAVLDAATGERVVDFEVAGNRTQIVGIDDRMAWEDDDTLVVRVMTRDDFDIIRLGLDGTVERVDIPSAGASGLSVAEER